MSHRFEHEGLAVWYGGEDTPAPTGEQSAQGATLVIGVAPAHPLNSVSVRYRVDGGVVRTLPAAELLGARQPGQQRFRATFPRLPQGSTVEYKAVLSVAGRQVPPPAAAVGLGESTASFRIAEPAQPVVAAPTPAPAATEPLPFRTELLTRVSVTLAEGEVIGETPDGLKVNWWVKSGSFQGPKLRGVVRGEGADFMTIRRDGIGVIDVRSVFETSDGALISSNYGGVFELGPDGYQNFLAGKFPPAPQMRGAPRYVTADSRYLWLNRLQCVVAGQVDMARRIVTYDVYGIR